MGVRAERVTADDTMLLTIDYRNAFPTLSHNFIQGVLNSFSLPPTFAKLVIASRRSQYHFLVGSAAIKEVTFSREAGIGHREPFSPRLFVFCAAIVIHPMRQLHARLGFHLYVDDFLSTLASDVTLSQVEHIFQELRTFLQW